MKSYTSIAGTESRQVALPPSGWLRLRTLASRSLRLHCAYCGGDKILQSWMTLKETCPHCQTRFVREHGYFQGAMAVNVAVSEGITMATIVALFVFTAVSWVWMELIVLPLAVVLPFLFWPFARTLWITLDLMLAPEQSDNRHVKG